MGRGLNPPIGPSPGPPSLCCYSPTGDILDFFLSVSCVDLCPLPCTGRSVLHNLLIVQGQRMIFCALVVPAVKWTQ